MLVRVYEGLLCIDRPEMDDWVDLRLAGSLASLVQIQVFASSAKILRWLSKQFLLALKEPWFEIPSCVPSLRLASSAQHRLLGAIPSCVLALVTVC